MIKEQIRNVAEAALAVSALRPGSKLDTHSVGGAIAGYLLRARRLLRALLVLDEAGLADTGEGMVRAMLEYAATAAWLLTDPEENLAILIGDHRRAWRMIRDEGVEVPDHIAQWINSHEQTPEARLPSVLQRVEAAGLRESYLNFRLVSMPLHASVLAARLAGQFDAEGQLVTADGETSPTLQAIGENMLLLGTSAVLRLADSLNTAFAGDRHDIIEAVLDRLLAIQPLEDLRTAAERAAQSETRPERD